MSPVSVSKRTKQREAGKILIELLISVPLLLGVPLTVLELARYLRFAQLAVVLSQEAAITAYRECSDLFAFQQVGENTVFQTSGADGATARTQTCLNSQGAIFQTRVAQMLPGAQLVLSVYRANYGGSALAAVGKYRSGAPDTHFSAVGTEIKRGSVTAVSSSSVTNRQRLAIGEVVFTYQPLLTLIPLLRNGTTSLGIEYRETTIL